MEFEQNSIIFLVVTNSLHYDFALLVIEPHTGNHGVQGHRPVGGPTGLFNLALREVSRHVGASKIRVDAKGVVVERCR